MLFLFVAFPRAVNHIKLLKSNDVIKLTVVLDHHLFRFTTRKENEVVYHITMECINVFTAEGFQEVQDFWATKGVIIIALKKSLEGFALFWCFVMQIACLFAGNIIIDLDAHSQAQSRLSFC